MDAQVMVAIITGVFGLLGAAAPPLTTQVIIPMIRRRGRYSPPESKPQQPLSTFLYAGVGGVIGVLLA